MDPINGQNVPVGGMKVGNDFHVYLVDHVVGVFQALW